jgi:hypothetical protein
MHAVEQFRERLDTLDRYPTGVVRVCRPWIVVVCGMFVR